VPTLSLNSLSYRIIAAAIEIHRALGPGLLKAVEHVLPVYRQQLLTDLRHTKKPLEEADSQFFLCVSVPLCRVVDMMNFYVEDERD
jgi:hypothetical protein